MRAQIVVDASGRWSNLSRPQAPTNGEGKWIGLKAHFLEAAPPASVDLYFFEGGYCGVQAIGAGAINVCAMVRSDVATDLAAVFELAPPLGARSAAWKPITAAIATSPLVFGSPEPWRERIFRVGDAAGFIDPFVGDGITLALLSGELAAECIAEVLHGARSLEASGQKYANAYRERLAPLFRRSSWLRRLVRASRPLRSAAQWALRFESVARRLAQVTRPSL